MKDDINNMDDTRLLMQYFRKHDTDNNHRLDGLELLKAIANMEEDHKHDDEEDDADPDLAHDDHPGDGPMKVDLEQIIPIVDSILEQDDKVINVLINMILDFRVKVLLFKDKDGYLNYAEFMSRQKQHMVKR